MARVAACQARSEATSALTTIGYGVCHSKVAVAPWPWQMPLTSVSMRPQIDAQSSSSMERMDTSSQAVSGMTLPASPAWREPTLTMFMCFGSRLRLTIVFSMTVTSLATMTGSTDSWGFDEWPPRPRMEMETMPDIVDTLPRQIPTCPMGCGATWKA